ncbi:Rieske (2Fe-2S) protein [Streptomyces sp. ISL-12]|uniref:Rieske (2Fe-2S) protein n=1 Tax=Streptomyces sp. ISL-12 TaxID=2819177 RepID=UPI001BE7419C|nr:Rieske (2Fe-2S) protein [Streptomyces sp. ISL-12]MBT2413040.1 Rieske (2Fe-2S) protein [Streptomyces sp. ISL-12]
MTRASLHPSAGPARRTVVAAAGAAGLAVALSACSDSDTGSGTDSDTGSRSGGTPDATGPASSPAEGATAQALASAADIPEGGGVVFAEQKVVVTQPSAGEFKAFSATCTHQGCAVKEVSDGVINCPCHNSNFSITDGSVQSGPAREPLPAVEIAVDGESISLV